MSDTDKFITVYTGTEVNVQYLQSIFDKEKIDTLVKNNFESGLRSGFGGGLPGQVQLQVPESQFEKAAKIAEEVFPDTNEDEEE